MFKVRVMVRVSVRVMVMVRVMLTTTSQSRCQNQLFENMNGIRDSLIFFDNKKTCLIRVGIT